MAENPQDITIVGGGLVGISLALLLAQAKPQWRICLIESHASPPSAKEHVKTVFQPGFDARSTAISSGSVAIFEQLGIWPDLAPGATAINHVQVSDAGHPGRVSITAEQLSVPALGYVLENPWLGQVLMAAAQGQPSIQCLMPAQVVDLNFAPNCAAVTLADGRQFDSRLVVVADGADSPLRAKLGIHSQVHDYQQSVVVANVSFSQAHGNRAFERFTRTGPMALLPLQDEQGQDRRGALVWTQPGDQAEALAALDDEAFLSRLQKAFGFRVGRLQALSRRVVYPLQLRLAAEQVRRRLVLAGNAAHFLHPVAGQGFNLSLRDCATLARHLLRTEDPGDLATLLAYADERQQDQDVTIGFGHALIGLFGSDSAAVTLGRNLGLAALATLPSARKLLAGQLMGRPVLGAAYLRGGQHG